jgi:hypothetical protein
MHFRRIAFITLSLSLMIIIIVGCRSTPPQANRASDANPLFLQNNIHAQIGPRDTKASYANWTDPGGGHTIIPVNTPVEFGRYRRGFTIKNLNDGSLIYFEYNQRNMGMSVGEYISLITSSNKVDLNKLSAIDKDGIRDGKARVGMSKKGVRIALGYPAAHRTPSLDNNTWVYWRNRFTTKVIEFDTRGKVKKIRF